MTALSCNPAKHAIRQKEAIDKAIAEHILNNPIPYSEILIPGDTIIVRDTLDHEVVLIDTFFIQDTVKIEIAKWRTIFRTNRVVDTFIRTVDNQKEVRRLMEERAAVQQRLSDSERRSNNLLWWLIACGVLLLISVLIRLK